MNFLEAMTSARDQQKVVRRPGGDYVEIIYDEDDKLHSIRTVYRTIDDPTRWANCIYEPDVADIFASDWQVVDLPPLEDPPPHRHQCSCGKDWPSESQAFFSTGDIDRG